MQTPLQRLGKSCCGNLSGHLLAFLACLNASRKAVADGSWRAGLGSGFSSAGGVLAASAGWLSFLATSVYATSRFDKAHEERNQIKRQSKLIKRQIKKEGELRDLQFQFLATEDAAEKEALKRKMTRVRQEMEDDNSASEDFADQAV